MAIKRERQAANAPSIAVAQELAATAKSYRALADALANDPGGVPESSEDIMSVVER